MATLEGVSAFEVSLETLNINLICVESSAQFVNPLTLYSNGIVDETWVCEKGAQMGLTHSTFSYTNGVEVEAVEDVVGFRHDASPLIPSAVLSAKLAKRYADALGIGNFIAVSMEFAARIKLLGKFAASSETPWPPIVDSLVLQGVQPRFSAEVFYVFPDRSLRAELGCVPNSNPTELTCNGWVHRYLEGTPDQARSTLQTTLDGWESDWGEVIDAASRLFEATLTT